MLFLPVLKVTGKLTIPMLGLPAGKGLELSLANTFYLPSAQSAAGGRSSSRASFYSEVEQGLSRLSGVPGRHCLLRAMCEVAATPSHDEVGSEIKHPRTVFKWIV